MEFEEVLRKRHSCRAFKPDKVSKEDLQTIVDAAQLAPIAGADYSMTHLTVITDEKLLEEIDEKCSIPLKNGKVIKPLYGAPAMIVTSVTGPSKDNIEYSNVGCAIENMILEATNLGLGSVYLWGWTHKLRKQPELIEKFNLPEGYTIISAIAIGYKADDAIEDVAVDAPVEQKIAVDWME